VAPTDGREENVAANMPLLPLFCRRGCRGRPRGRVCRSFYPLVLIGRPRCTSSLGQGGNVRFVPPGSRNVEGVDGTSVLPPACECRQFHEIESCVSCAGFGCHGYVRVVALDVPRFSSIVWSIGIEVVDGQNASPTTPLDWEVVTLTKATVLVILRAAIRGSAAEIEDRVRSRARRVCVPQNQSWQEMCL
jgi:hypothetical protein